MDYDTCYWRGTDMKTTLRSMVLPVGVCLLWLTSAARAENFVQVFYDEEGQVFAEVDVDSIHKDSDGFTYFKVRADIGDSDRAVDCATRTLYLIRDTMWSNPDWRKDGHAVSEGSVGAAILNFACAHSP
jgi:hypothetical protein